MSDDEFMVQFAARFAAHAASRLLEPVPLRALRWIGSLFVPRPPPLYLGNGWVMR